LETGRAATVFLALVELVALRRVAPRSAAQTFGTARFEGRHAAARLNPFKIELFKPLKSFVAQQFSF
jgi:hypothetical protein